MLQESRTGFKTIYENGEGEVIEKKSRFIAITAPVQSEEEALAFLESIRKKYWDARHHCYAYILGEKKDIRRMSDDGEPTGTAGKPILDLIEGGDLTNTIIVVTRYFGGTLLGTGGLARAYSSAARAALAAAVIITKIPGQSLHITTDYTALGKIQHLLAARGVHTLATDYTDKVSLEILVPAEEISTLTTVLTEATNAKAEIHPGAPRWYTQINNQIHLF